MDFHLNEDQLALQDTIAGFCQTQWSLERVADRPCDGFDRASWNALVELGVTSVMVPEERGGLGLGAVEGAVVFEQLGYHLVPGPLLWTTLGALVLPQLASGEWLAGGTLDHGQSPLFVEYASEVDTYVVLRTDGVARIDRAQADPTPAIEALDPQSSIGYFDTLPAGTPVADATESAKLRQLGVVLTAALQLGVAHAALDVAVRYSLEREQFDVPIGSFQALKHIMADMYVRIGLARSATYAAAAVFDDPEVGDLERSISAAKLLSGEAAVENARASIQIFGGMGFTWEMAPNFLLKRALVLDQAFGTPTAHALAISSALAKEVA